MPKRTKSYETGLQERLKDPAYAMEYLRAALEDDDEGSDAVFLLALRDVAQANHMTRVAEATGLNRESLYKMLSRRGNPGLNSLKAVLSAVGLRLSVEVAATGDAAAEHVASWGRRTGHVQFSYDDPLPGVEPCAVGRESLAKPPPRAGSDFLARESC
ncbi:MAG TPA: addiction module antidote protein [Bryobacteraceae bacterium]|nr:addiction module antidote protein [Bryobacteraceae bacterium]